MILGAMWGSSFLFIKVSVAEISPTFVVAARFAFAVLTLLVALPFLGRLSGAGAVIPDAAKLWRPMLVLGALNAALPYFTISWGTQSFPAAPPPYSTPPSRSSPSYSPSSCPPSPPNASALLASSAFCSAHSVSACSSAASTASMVARPSPERALCSSGLQATPPETSTPAAR